MTEHIVIGLASILVLGIGAQWLAWRLRLPSILLLLLSGFFAGPITGALNPDELFGPLLIPIVSVSVAIILFEGGLSLKISELRKIGGVVTRLVTLGTLITWLAGTTAALLFTGLGLKLSLLLGAILVVTGPTVIIPLLRHVRPTGQVASILKWEGIVIDPIGATLAVLVFETIISGKLGTVITVIIFGIVKTVLISCFWGVLGAAVLVLVLKKFWVPDFLQNPISLMIVIGSFAVSNIFQKEAGLLTVTIMGVILANQRITDLRDIVEFKENLRVLFISSLFVILAARFRLSDLEIIGPGTVAFLIVMILIARPLSVALCTKESSLLWNERVFLAWMAPRGIVAAAVSAVFALRLEEYGYPDAERLVQLTFLVIVATVALYGLTASPLARLLDLAKPNPQGVLIVGAHSWARSIAAVLKSEKVPVFLVDTNRPNIFDAHMEGLPAYHGNVLSQKFMEEADLTGIGRVLALTSNNEVNSLAAIQLRRVVGRSETYQLPSQEKGGADGKRTTRDLQGRQLFREGLTHEYMERLFAEGAKIKKNGLSDKFDYDAFQKLHGEQAVPMFLIDKNGVLSVFATDNQLIPKPGQTLISLITDSAEPGEGRS